MHNSLHPYFRWALEQDEIDRSPMEEVPPPKKNVVYKDPLTPEEVARLREVTRGRTFERRKDGAEPPGASAAKSRRADIPVRGVRPPNGNR